MRARRVAPGTVHTRVRHVVDRLTASGFQAGETWWDDARTTIRNISIMSGKDETRIAAALAILSPIKTWDETVKMTQALAMDRFARQQHWSKAWTRARIAIWTEMIHTIDGYKPLDVYDLVRGPKVCPFFCALLGDVDAVTIDRHMIRSAYPTDTQTTHRILTLQWAIRDLSYLYLQGSISPRDLQAAVWLKVRKGQV